MSETLLLRDERNQILECEILKQVNLDNQSYALVMPVHQPVQVLAWEEDDSETERSHTDILSPETNGEDGEGGLVDLEPDELEIVLPTAQAVVEELNLKLRQSAYTLTVEGELPEPQEEDLIEIANEDNDVEEFQLLATFFHVRRQYGVFAPLDPLLFFAVQPDSGNPYLLSPDAPIDLLERLQDRLLDLADS